LNYRLRSQKQPEITTRINQSSWYGSLELAQEYGWNPMGTILPQPSYKMVSQVCNEFLYPDLWRGDYWTYSGSLVLFEDALNLADALEDAFLKYYPVFVTYLNFFYPFRNNHSAKKAKPSISVIRILIDFCRMGSFHIDLV